MNEELSLICRLKDQFMQLDEAGGSGTKRHWKVGQSANVITVVIDYDAANCNYYDDRCLYAIKGCYIRCEKIKETQNGLYRANVIGYYKHSRTQTKHTKIIEERKKSVY